MTVKLDKQGRITLPETVREKLNLTAGDRLEFLIHNDGTLEIFPVTSPITELKGMLPKPDKPVSLEDMNDGIAEAVSSKINATLKHLR